MWDWPGNNSPMKFMDAYDILNTFTDMSSTYVVCNLQCGGEKLQSIQSTIGLHLSANRALKK